MAGKTAAQLVAEMLATSKVEYESKASTRCTLCNLPKAEREALDLICKTRKETGRPTLRDATRMLNKIGIHTNTTSFGNHYSDHWNGETKPEAKNR